jgi:hypothetical protein
MVVFNSQTINTPLHSRRRYAAGRMSSGENLYA